MANIGAGRIVLLLFFVCIKKGVDIGIVNTRTAIQLGRSMNRFTISVDRDTNANDHSESVTIPASGSGNVSICKAHRNRILKQRRFAAIYQFGASASIVSRWCIKRSWTMLCGTNRNGTISLGHVRRSDPTENTRNPRKTNQKRTCSIVF